MEEDAERYGNSQGSMVLYQDANVIRERFDTDKTLLRLERALRGTETFDFHDTKTGTVQTHVKKYANPVCNEEGYERILAKFKLYYNTQSYQSYFKDQQRYEEFVRDVWKDFAAEIMEKRIDWGIRVDDYDYIVNSIAQCIRLGLTQAIEGKAMDSVTKTTKTTEYNQPVKSGSIFSSVFGGSK